MATKTRLFVVTGCHSCPNCEDESTRGAGYAMDYYCKAAKPKDGKRRLIAGYVEWARELRPDGNFPEFCPLKAGTPKRSNVSKKKA